MPLVTLRAAVRAPSAALFFQEFFGFHGGHAARAGGGDRLAIAAVLNVAAGINAGHPGADVIAGDEIAVLIGLKLAVEHPGIGNMANAQEHGTSRKLPEVTILHI